MYKNIIAILSSCLFTVLGLSPGFIYSPPGSCGNTAFLTPKTSPGVTTASTVAYGDFNNDGVLDLAVGPVSQSISIFLGDGKGAFAPIASIAFEGFVRNIVVADLNGDHNLDLIFTSMTIQDKSGNYKPGVGIAFGLGDGRFAAPVGNEAGSGAAFVATGDFNGDGKLDIAAVDGGRSLAVLFSKGDGAFDPPLFFDAGQGNANKIAVADFNNDGKPEIAVGYYLNPQVSVFKYSNNNFSLYATAELSDPNYITTGDVDGDGNQDLICTPFNSVAVLRGDGATGFAKPVYYFGATPYSSVQLADFNGDGRKDLALIKAGNARGAVAVSASTGNLSFATPIQYGAGQQPSALAVADFNGDGKADIVAVNSVSGDISFLPNDGAGNFPQTAILETGNFINQIVVSDTNADGQPDIFVSNNTGQTVASYGIGKLGYSPEYTFGTDFGVWGFVWSSVIGDFDRDGKPDLVALNNDTSNYLTGVATFLPDNGLFAQNPSAFVLNNYKLRIKRSYAGGRAMDAKVADFDQDGKLDIVTVNADTNTVTFLVGDGTGAFGVAATAAVGTDPRSVAVGDLDGDGWADAVVANRGSAGVDLFLNTFHGGFTTRSIAVPTACRKVLIADMNKDGKQDLVLLSASSPMFYVLPGTGGGNFGTAVQIKLGGLPLDGVIADFSNDGIPDLAITRYKNATDADDTVQILAGDGKNGFVTYQQFKVPGASQLATADLDQDGLADLVVASKPVDGVNAVRVLLNSCEPPPAAEVVTVNAASYSGVGVSPDSIVAAFGSQLSSGTGNAQGVPLPTQLSGTTVRVKDAKGVERLAPLFFISPYQVNYQIPSNTAAGVAKVTFSTPGLADRIGTILVLPTGPGIFAANADANGVAAANIFRLKFGSPDGVYEPLLQFDQASQRYVPLPVDGGSVFPPSNDTLYLLLYGTGIRSRGSLAKIQVTVGGVSCAVEYAGPHCCFIGVDQLNVRLPQAMNGRGEVDIVVTVDGQVTNTTTMAFKP